MSYFIQLLTLALLSGPAAAGTGAPASARRIYRSDDLGLVVETQTLKQPRIDELIRGLSLRPGMTIVDIGAGTGQASYKLAEALKGTGKVFATDVDPRLVEYVTAQAKKRGLANLEARLVSPEGVDPFYAQQSYDLILMYDVNNYLTDRRSYYKKLRSLLKPDGRLVLVEAEAVQDRSFYREDFSDWPGFLEALRREPLDSPFGRLLRAPLGKELEAGPRPDDPVLARSVLFHLNKALDVKFYLQFSHGPELDKEVESELSAQERPYAAWLLHRMALDDVAGREIQRIEVQLLRLMETLNKLILIAHYRPYLAAGDVHPYWSRGPEVTWLREHDRRVEELRGAGFALERRTPLVPFQAIWVFKAAP